MNDTRQDSGGDEGTPRWVKALGIVFAVLALLFIGLHFTGGPRLHGGHSEGGNTSPSGQGARP